MRVKLTSRNQFTLPKAVMNHFPGTKYFQVTVEGGRIVLTPVDLGRGEAVRAKLAELGVTPKDVRQAIRWTREGK